MAGRFDLTRRRALQLGAGAAFSAPTIVSLASTPAYADGNSGGPITIDDFTLSQSGHVEVPSDGSFLFDERGTYDSNNDDRFSSITNGLLVINKPADLSAPDLRYYKYTNGPDLSACSKLVLQNVIQFSANPRVLIIGPGGSSSTVLGSNGVSTIEFELDGVHANTLGAPSGLRFYPDYDNTSVASAIFAFGPLIGQ